MRDLVMCTFMAITIMWSLFVYVQVYERDKENKHLRINTSEIVRYMRGQAKFNIEFNKYKAKVDACFKKKMPPKKRRRRKAV